MGDATSHHFYVFLICDGRFEVVFRVEGIDGDVVVAYDRQQFLTPAAVSFRDVLDDSHFVAEMVHLDNESIEKILHVRYVGQFLLAPSDRNRRLEISHGVVGGESEQSVEKARVVEGVFVGCDIFFKRVSHALGLAYCFSPVGIAADDFLPDHGQRANRVHPIIEVEF